MNNTLAVVLAAGQGTRMKSELPKVLCPVLGRPMLDYVLDALTSAGIEKIVLVIGYRADDVRAHVGNRSGISFVVQSERLGTGHAVKMALPILEQHSGNVMIVAGDSPLIQAVSVKRVLQEFEQRKPACLLGTLKKENPTGLGRIVRDSQGNFQAIVEEKDATPAQRQIQEVNMSTYMFNAVELVHALRLLKNENKQQEYYLTDCPGILLSERKSVLALPVLQPCEALSINTLEELSAVEARMMELGYERT